MNKSELDLCISYGQEKVIFFFEKGTSFSVFRGTLVSHFETSEQKIKLFEEERNAEIISTRSLDSKKEYRIILKQSEPNLLQPNLASSSLPANLDCQSNLNNAPVSQGKINLNYFKGKSIAKTQLIIVINEWAGALKFKMAFSEGKKIQKNKLKRTVICSEKNCHFKLVFFSDLQEKDYSLDFKSSAKYDTHNKVF